MVARYDCLKFLAEVAGDTPTVIWGSGRDEWWHLRPDPPGLTTALGCSTSVGLGLALAIPKRKVLVLDTDGGILFNLGTLTTLGNHHPPNLKVFVMDNECYESIGAMPSATAGRADLAAIAKACGIERAGTTRTLKEFQSAATRAFSEEGLHFVVAKVDKGMKSLPPHYTDMVEVKYKFVRDIERSEGIHIIMPPLQKTPKELLKD